MAREALNEPAEIPAELNRWNWGAFLLNWIWGIGNSTFIALLALIPVVNIVVMVVLGAKGSRWAWRNRAWRDAAHFKRSQRHWAIAGVVVWIAVMGGLISVPFGIFGAIKSSVAYQMTMDSVHDSDQVRQALGTPIKSGFWVTGNVNVSVGGSGSAELSIPLTGSRGSGSAYSRAVRTDGKWQLRLVVVNIDGSDTPIVLINEDHVVVPNAAIGA